MTAPLDGIKVLDLTRLLPGPMCTLHLADLGADVIKIEHPVDLDPARRDPTGQRAMSALFHSLNRNKRAVTLDLRAPEGVEILLQLVEQADVLVEGFRPGVMDRLGLGPEVVQGRNPALIYASITGYGQDGPWRDKAGHDINFCATAGLLDQVGEADGPPSLGNFQIADLAGGALSGAVAILAALVGRARSGRGERLDVSMTDCTLAHAVLPLAQSHLLGQAPPRGLDMLTGGLACYAVYRAADDRYLAVGALERKFWDAVCEGLGRPDLKDRHLAIGPAAAALKAEVAALFAAAPLAHWAAVFAELDACVTPVLTLDEALAHPHLQARGVILDHVDPVDGVIKQFAAPWRFADHVFQIRRGAPAPGAHTDEILTAAGFDAEALAGLRARGVIGPRPT